jgi:amino acid permease
VLAHPSGCYSFVSLKERLCLAKVTVVFAVLLIALGLVGYFGTGAQHATALIPTWFGAALGMSGLLAMSPDEGRRKLFMHINVTLGLIGFIGVGVESIRGYLSASHAGKQPDMVALASKLTMTGLLLVYVIVCVRSFIAARRARQV